MRSVPAFFECPVDEGSLLEPDPVLRPIEPPGPRLRFLNREQELAGRHVLHPGTRLTPATGSSPTPFSRHIGSPGESFRK